MSPDLVPYVMLLRAITEARLSEDEFSLLYLTMFKHDPARREQAIFDLLQGVFSAADLYYPDADPTKEFEVNAAELRRTAAEALQQLEAQAS